MSLLLLLACASTPVLKAPDLEPNEVVVSHDGTFPNGERVGGELTTYVYYGKNREALSHGRVKLILGEEDLDEQTWVEIHTTMSDSRQLLNAGCHGFTVWVGSGLTGELFQQRDGTGNCRVYFNRSKPTGADLDLFVAAGWVKRNYPSL